MRKIKDNAQHTYKGLGNTTCEQCGNSLNNPVHSGRQADRTPVARESAFSVMYDSRYGKTVCVTDPRIEAYKYTAMCLSRYASQIPGAYSMVFHSDNSVTVAMDGLLPITFESGN